MTFSGTNTGSRLSHRTPDARREQGQRGKAVFSLTGGIQALLSQAGGGRAPRSLGSALWEWRDYHPALLLLPARDHQPHSVATAIGRETSGELRKPQLGLIKTYSIREPGIVQCLAMSFYITEGFTQTASLLIVAAGMV